MNCTELDVLLSPAEFEGLPEQDLSDTSCVVFDVLRATSTMTVALANGAEAILPCATIGEAIAARESEPGLLLAGERGGQRITAEISGGTEFDLGNSPREMTRDVVAEKRMAATTTTGTPFYDNVLICKILLTSNFQRMNPTGSFTARSRSAHKEHTTSVQRG